jgi:hypothetical protein
MPSLKAIRAELEALHCELNLDSLLVRSGLKGALSSTEAVARHPLPAQRSTVELLRARLREAEGEGRERLRRLFFGCVDAHLQWQLSPLDDATSLVLSGSGVEVDGEFVHYFQTIPWLQRQDCLALRAQLARAMEGVYRATNPLLLRLLADEDRLLTSLGFGGYLGYCRAKKGLDYAAAVPVVESLLSRTAGTYFARMEEWVAEEYGRKLAELTRFDCIHLLKLGRFDALFPPERLKRLPKLLSRMGLAVDHPNIRLDLAPRRRKNPQAVCIGVRIPQEVHLVVKPQGGLLDCESFLHELGHALQLAHFDPRLPFEYRCLPRSRALSETFAFLFQGLTANRAFLAALGVPPAEAEALRRMRLLKDLALWRRYGAKLIAEVKMWSGRLSEGGELYSATLTAHTGFRYEPAGYLADMEPELYAADYLWAWMAEAQLSARLEREFGEAWPLEAGCSEFFLPLWRQGERHSLEQVLRHLGESPFDPGPLESRLAELA